MSRRRARHRPTCRHCPRVRLLGHEFRVWRASWDGHLELATAGYATETAAYLEEHTAPTFRAYLEAMAGTGWPMSGSAPRRTLVGVR